MSLNTLKFIRLKLFQNSSWNDVKGNDSPPGDMCLGTSELIPAFPSYSIGGGGGREGACAPSPPPQGLGSENELVAPGLLTCGG